MSQLKLGLQRHPYLPKDLSLPGYKEIEHPLSVLLGGPAAVGAAILLAAWLLSGGRGLSTAQRLLVCWFAFTGAVHMFIEGAFVLTPTFYKQSGVMNDIWKEYSKADSRYASRDAFTVCMEAVTAFVEGPGCWVIVYGILHRRPWTYVLQLSVSLGQLYGDVLYFATCFFDGAKYSRPEAQYWYGYFLILNNVWVVIPLLACWQACARINAAVAQTARVKNQ